MEKDSIKVWLFSQQPLFRQGVRQAFEQANGIEIIGEAETSEKLSQTIEVLPPQVAIVDLDQNAEMGLRLCLRLKQVTPTTGIIVTTSCPSDEQLFSAIRNQVSAFIVKDIKTGELCEVVRKVAHGEHPINDTLNNRPSVAKHILEEFQELSKEQAMEELVSPLTEREIEIISLMAKGYANKQIAGHLNVSEQTIKNHITSILSKLDANARTEAVVKAIKRGLISINNKDGN
jgi:DNA-binding NarL/FixJ family response regulator